MDSGKRSPRQLRERGAEEGASLPWSSYFFALHRLRLKLSDKSFLTTFFLLNGTNFLNQCSENWALATTAALNPVSSPGLSFPLSYGLDKVMAKATRAGSGSRREVG